MNMQKDPSRNHSRIDAPSEDKDTVPIKRRIEMLINNQPYAVLCTQGEGQPYGSLVAFAFSDDATRAVFATPTATRKYKLLSKCPRVALVIDNRPDHVDDMMQVEAITATGQAMEIHDNSSFTRCADLLLARHPYLKTFVMSDSSALFEIHIVRFLHVTRFQEVNQWVPAKK